MEATSPRQRQYLVAIQAQQHNLATNLQETLYNLAANTPPPGKSVLLDRWRDIDRTRTFTASTATLLNLSVNDQGTLNNLTANTPPPGVQYQPDRYRRAPHLGWTVAQLHNLSINMQVAGIPYPPLPPGQQRFPERVRAFTRPYTDWTRFQQHDLSTNLQPTLFNEAANVPPTGVQYYPDRYRPRLLPNPLAGQMLDNSNGATLSALLAPPLPAGAQYYPDRYRSPREAFTPMRVDLHNLSENLQGTLFNLGANVPPQGRQLFIDQYLLRQVANPLVRIGQANGFSIANAPPATIYYGAPLPVGTARLDSVPTGTVRGWAGPLPAGSARLDSLPTGTVRAWDAPPTGTARLSGSPPEGRAG